MEVYMKIFAIILVVLTVSGCGLFMNQPQELTGVERAYIIYGRQYLAQNPDKTVADWDIEFDKRCTAAAPAMLEYMASRQQARSLERIADAAEWQSIERMYPQPVIIVPNR
jgi:hypothetical protein